MFWLVWTWSDTEGLDHLALLHHRRLGRRPGCWSILGSRAFCYRSGLRDEVLFNGVGSRLQPRISHMVSSMCHSAVVGCKRIRKVCLVVQSPLRPPLLHSGSSHSFHRRLCARWSLTCSLHCISSRVVRHGDPWHHRSQGLERTCWAWNCRINLSITRQ